MGLWRPISLGGWRRRDLGILHYFLLHEATTDANQAHQNQPDCHYGQVPFQDTLLRGPHRGTTGRANAGGVAHLFLAFMTIYQGHIYSSSK
jgi:hypothetical protein